MPTTYLNTPGVQINEVRLDPAAITGVGTSTAGFVGVAPKAAQFAHAARLVTSADQFLGDYTDLLPATTSVSTPLSRAVLGFFANGGTQCYVVNVQDDTAANAIENGIKLLEPIDAVAIIAAPGYANPSVYTALEDQAKNTGDRFAILDPPAKVADLGTLLSTPGAPANPGVRPTDSSYAAFYYPRIMMGNQLPGDALAAPVAVSPTGHIAGVYARVDAAKGVHKAPANEALRGGVLGVEHALTDADQNALNAEAVNVLRVFSEGVVVWGARTLLGTTAVDTSYRYINVRRLVNYIEESLQDGLRWAVFEPNNLSLRKQIARTVRGFLDGIWRDGGLFGATPEDAYYVRFPETGNSDADRANGILTIEIGLRATFPAEFIRIRIGLLLQSATAA